MSDTPDNNSSGTGNAAANARRLGPLSITAIVLAALLLVGGVIFAVMTIIGQQNQLDHLNQLVEDRSPSPASTPTESASPSASPSAAPSASPSASPAPRAAAWSDINGTWCSAVQGCRTIAGLVGGSGEMYSPDGGPDANGCIHGWSGTSGEPHNANVEYCPVGASFVWMTNPTGECHMSEDLTRERFWAYQDCADPFYRP